MTVPGFAGYAALFLWVFLGEAGLPLFVPAELLLVAGGVAAAHEAASLALVVAIAVAADVLGGLSLFALVRLTRGRRGRLGRLERLVERATGTARAVGADSSVRVAAARCVPFLRIPSALAAALVALPLPRFAVALVVGGTVWVAVFAGGAYLFAARVITI